MDQKLQNYRINLLNRQANIEKKIKILQEEYNDIDKELDRVATKSKKRLPKEKKSNEKDENCIIM
jgi:hypothetical protein